MNQNILTLALFSLILTLSFKIKGQTNPPPIPVEIMLGHNRYFFQMVMKRQFTPESKFGFFTVTTFTSTYEENSPENRITVPVQIDYELYKGFSVFVGTRINSFAGFTPIVGPKHSFITRNILAITLLSYYANGNNEGQVLGLYEFKPKLGDKLSLYTRIQFMYIRNFEENRHNRSYLYLRAGLKLGKWNFGMGANFDRFGPQKEFVENYGPFLRYDF
ncbi:hypothetical protein [Flexithrix dorotheae]|uniref:hypothetical protein n=1 Tax=Flexithrix dorotheae TaxID=70993 RepID=UPI00037AC4D8|nr:hypothetical protein [Flexithrix dorotheae]